MKTSDDPKHISVRGLVNIYLIVHHAYISFLNEPVYLLAKVVCIVLIILLAPRSLHVVPNEERTFEQRKCGCEQLRECVTMAPVDFISTV